jgi:hypothetical protein
MRVNFRLVLAMGLASGCARIPTLHDRLMTSEASVMTAERLVVRTSLAATTELGFAVAELQGARDLMASGDDEKARLELIQSEEDAERAIELAHDDTGVKADATVGVTQLRLALTNQHYRKR